MTPDDLVERVARALVSNDSRLKGQEDRLWKIYANDARAAIAIALEEAARVAEIYEYDELEDDGGATIKPSAAIRAMIKGNDVQQA
jgi:hypothetical protein